MSKRTLTTFIGTCLMALLLAGSAQAAFDVTAFDVTYENKDGTPATQAGSHPFAVSGSIDFATKPGPKGGVLPDGSFKDLTVDLPPGLVGDRAAAPYCSTADFLSVDADHETSTCPAGSVIGRLLVRDPGEVGGGSPGPVFNLAPPPGAAAKIGIILLHIPIAATIRVNPDAPHNLVMSFSNTPNVEPLGGSTLTIWGNPASADHDLERGQCGKPSCPVDLTEKPFLTMPRSCTGPLVTGYAADSWESPGALTPKGTPNLSDPNWISGISESHDDAVPPNPLGLSGCGKLAFGPTITAKPTTLAANSPSGLDFSLDVTDEGLANPEGAAGSDVRKAVVSLPEGFSVNPSIAEGLNVCTVAELERETALSTPGAGCPNESKIGTVEVQTPLLDESINGALYQAAPYENLSGSLIALYIVLKNPNLGISIVQPVRVEPDPVTGRLTTVAEDLPQLPFSHFKLHFREGTRSPLATPPLCGTYNASAVLTPWSGGAPITTNSVFQIITGPNAGACPSGTSQPFHPGLEAGTITNSAGKYSPFYVHISRNDGEQEITHFSIKLPPGVVGKLAGIPYCPDAAIAAATARTGAHGGQEELSSPSCPAASEVGHSLAGAGVGPSLAYAPGKMYLAGPYHGSALSLVSITAAKVGPFDLGTVVVRFALKINSETAEVFVDAAGSDPIPHIINGIPVHLRDIRAYVDRPEFVLNPTNCERTSTASTVLGSGLNFGSEADDQPVTVTSPFQAADCASLAFKPKLALSLKGGTKRAQNPAFKAVLTFPKGSNANVAAAQVTLPHSAFLDNDHIRTVCTRVQFAAGGGNGEQCPARSIYGRARATTPILAEPLEGPVFLRSSSHPLPDLVAALHNGQININLVGRIDSAKGGRIRNTFESVPDAPVTKFVLEMQGGKKGLLVNSANLCKSTDTAIADFSGQNGKVHRFNPVLKPLNCKKKGKKAKHRPLLARLGW